MPETRPRFRKREIAFAIALGAGAASAGGIMVSEMYENEQRRVDEPSESRDETVDYGLGDFDEIAVTGPQDVIVTYGEGFSVTADGNSDSLGQMEAVVENGILQIRPRDGSFFGDWGDLDDVVFRVTLPRLERVALAGSGEVTIDRVEGENFAAVIGGPGDISIGLLAVDRADFNVTGSGELGAAGTARVVDASVSGSGEIAAGALRTIDASVSIAGSGDVDLDVSGQAAVSITGSGDVDITGTGVCSVTRMGGGDVRCQGGGGDEPD